MGVATTNLRTISNSPLLSSTVLPTSTLPDHQSNSQAMILIAGVSAGCVVIVLLVAIVIVVCSILSRSPDKRTVTVYSSKKVRALPRNNDSFVESSKLILLLQLNIAKYI